MENNWEIQIQLVGRCRNGDVKAQFALYKMYVKAMFNIANRFLNNRFDAEDVLQDSFATAFGKMNALKDDSTFGSWLKRIVINNCLTILRKKKTMVEEDIERFNRVDIEDESSLDFFPDPAIIHEKIKELPEKARVIFTLFALEDYKHKEIGDLLGITESTSKTQYFRARQLLISKLKENHHEE